MPYATASLTSNLLVTHLTTPHSWAKGSATTRTTALIKLELYDGVEGWGEIAPIPGDLSLINQLRRGDHLPALTEFEGFLRQAPHDWSSARTLLDRLADRWGNRIRCGLATAYLSALAAAQGVSLSQALATPQREPAKAIPLNGLIPAVSLDKCRQLATKFEREGIGTIKVKCGSGDFQDDLARFSAALDCHPQATLRIDANESWIDDFANRCHELSHLPVEYIEEPIPIASNEEKLKELLTDSPLPIAFDHWGSTVKDLRALLTKGLRPHTLILKSQVLGGPDRVVEVMNLAEKEGISCVVTASLESLVGITSAMHLSALLPSPIPPCGLYLWDFPLTEVAKRPAVIDGKVSIPQTPGLGISPIIEDS